MTRTVALRPSAMDRPMLPPAAADRGRTALKDVAGAVPLDLATAQLIATPRIDSMLSRCSAYLRAGFPVHFRGPAGTGKTTLALLLATRMGRPITWICGDDSFTSETLIGGETGFRGRQVVDRYVASVVKVEFEATPRWVDRMVTTACMNGHTLVYDEFTRSPAEANNVLLPVLEERTLVLPTAGRTGTRHRVNPDFAAIFTSNPADHVGVHGAPDALLDRMITIDVEFYDRETEIAMVASRSGLAKPQVAAIVDLVRDYRASEAFAQTPTLRAAVMIATVAAREDLDIDARCEPFVQLCLDVLAAKADLARESDRETHRRLLRRLIAHFCPGLSGSSLREVEP